MFICEKLEKLLWKLLFSYKLEDNCINVWCYLRFLVGWESLLEVLQVQDFEHLQIIHVSPYGGFYLVLTPTERSQIKACDDGIRLCMHGCKHTQTDHLSLRCTLQTLSAYMLQLEITTFILHPLSYSQPYAQIKDNLISLLNLKCSRIMWASAVGTFQFSISSLTGLTGVYLWRRGTGHTSVFIKFYGLMTVRDVKKHLQSWSFLQCS